MTGTSPEIVIITLNVNGLNFLIKRDRLAERIKKQKLSFAYKKCTSWIKTYID